MSQAETRRRRALHRRVDRQPRRPVGEGAAPRRTARRSTSTTSTGSSRRWRRHGLLSLAVDRGRKPGGDENWTIGEAPAPSCATDEAEQFGKVAGIRNADQVDRAFPAAELRGQPACPGCRTSAARIADMDRAGRRRLRHLPRRPERPVDPVLDDGAHRVGHTRATTTSSRSACRIYNRWLADFVAEAPERHIGIAHIPISDPEACVREVEWAAEHGLKGINLPAPRGDFPMLNDPVWEPLWAVCEETGTVAQHPRRRGRALPVRGSGRAGDVHDGDGLADPPRRLGDDPRRRLRPPPRPEAGADRAVDRLGGAGHGRHGRALPRPERRRAARRRSASRRRSTSGRTASSGRASCRTGRRSSASSTTSSATRCGATTIRTPRAPGRTPARRWRLTFCDIDPKYARQYLGDAAIDVYGLDRAELQQVADRIGPTVADLSPRPARPPEDETAGLYAFRTGPGIFV